MKISYTWLLDYLRVTDKGSAVTLSAVEIHDILMDVGLEVDEMERYESVPGGLEGLLIGEVKRVESHPNADRLKLTWVDTGHGAESQIVCGAPNVAVGQKVVVAPVDTTIHPIKGEPFTIKKAKIRGESSHGMICAEDEVGLGEDHDGIMVLDETAPIGKAASEYFDIFSDWVYDIGLTPNRADAMSHIGVAKDIVAYLQAHTNYETQLIYPKYPDLPKPTGSKSIEVEVRSPEACPRYAGLVIDQLEIGPAPRWMQNRLQSIGVKSINNVVDITNFILHEMGQPLHAFDYKAITGNKIVVQELPTGTEFLTLDDETRKLDREDLMICNAEDGMCIAGVYGGKGSGVTDKTKTIFLESAFFHPVHIRRTALRHNLRTDAAMHFEKGIDPNMAVQAVKRTVELLQTLAGASVASPLVDIYPDPVAPAEVNLSMEYLERLAGDQIPIDTVIAILESLEMKVTRSEDSLQIKVPTAKNEVTRPADIAEEILRIYGYNRLKMPEVMELKLHATQSRQPDRLPGSVSSLLLQQGFSEISTLSFIPGTLLEKLKLTKEANQANLENPLSKELDVMRPTLLPSMLQVVAYNQNRKNTDVKLFERGKTYFKKGDGYGEGWKLAIAMSGQNRPESWEVPSEETGFYDLKRTLHNLTIALGIKKLDIQPEEVGGYEVGLGISMNRKPVGKGGKVHDQIAKHFDLKKAVWYAELDWEALQAVAPDQPVTFKPILKFPAIRRDLAMLIDRSVEYGSLENVAREVGGTLLQEVNLFDIYSDKKLGKDKVSYALSYVFQDPQRTLTDKEIDQIMEKLIKRYEADLGATIRS